MENSEGSAITIISRQEGFDYDFVPLLDSKYECAICLLGLRSPMQTTCGHRFCKDCIFNCLSESSSRCPVDNTPLLESDLFADSCAEREILQLKVKCPNHALGCNAIVDLMYIEHHKHACSFQPVMCPNECSATVLQKELEQHLTSQCVLRVAKCALCDQPFTFNQEQLHLLSCALVTVTCEMCGAMMPRGEVASHTTELCPRVVVACTFAEHGCHHKMTRSDLDQHMEQAIQYHLQLLSSAYKKINAFVSDLSRTVALIQSPFGNFSRQPSLRSQMSATSPIPENHPSPSQPDKNLEKSFGACGGAAGYNDKYYFSPQNVGELSNEVNKLELQLNNLSANETSKSGLKGSNTISHQEIILRDVSEKTVDLNQRMLEETIKLCNMTKRIEEVDALVELQMADISGKFCNGDYVWKIRNFSHLCKEHQDKPGRVLHSPPFYTSQFGYKFCLRTNIMWKSEYFCTLFIHSMQGENDEFLDWPFSGQITLSILDCGPSLPKKHIKESMVSKPDLQAFQRPTVSRNPKGFGYTEFVPLAKLLNSDGGNYVNDDVLCIRAVVSPKACYVPS